MGDVAYSLTECLGFGLRHIWGVKIASWGWGMFQTDEGVYIILWNWGYSEFEEPQKVQIGWSKEC